VDTAEIERFAMQVMGDQSAGIGGLMGYLGDRLGLYQAMAGAGPLTSGELAERSGCAERYVREWLASQAAAGYVGYDPDSGAFTLSSEHAMVLAAEDSPAAMLGGFEVAAGLWAGADRVVEAFRSGQGVGWHLQDQRVFSGTERFYAAGYRASLVSAWLPALHGVVDKLQGGARVLDVGCGHGAATILMAQAFPRASFTGVDYHPASVKAAHQRAAEAGVADRVSFQVASATDYATSGWDLICLFDTLHDLGDPIGAAAHARKDLAGDGTLMVVEPRAGDRLEDNLHPLGRMFYGASTLLCTPNALSQHDGHGGLALGAQAGDARLREVLTAAGFTHVRLAAQSPVNSVFEARP
jgi:SAM-dependent methyltransferase